MTSLSKSAPSCPSNQISRHNLTDSQWNARSRLCRLKEREREGSFEGRGISLPRCARCHGATVHKIFTTPLLTEAIQACPLFLGCDSPKNCEFHKVGAYIPEGLGDSRIQRVPVTRCERSGIFLSLEVQVLSQAISDVLICCASE